MGDALEKLMAAKNVAETKKANDTLMAAVDPNKLTMIKKQPVCPVRIKNGAGEDEMGMTVSPLYLTFRIYPNTFAYDTFYMFNKTKVKQAFKVKSNNNKMYVSRPTTGFLEPGARVHVKVFFLNPERSTESQHKEPTDDVKKAEGEKKGEPDKKAEEKFKNDNPNKKIHVAVYHVAAAKFKTPKEAFKAKAKQKSSAGKPSVGDGVHHFVCVHRYEFPVDDGDQKTTEQETKQKGK